MNESIFGGGVFSMRGGKMLRQVGSRLIEPYLIRIAKPKGTVLFPDGVRRNGVSEPYMPETLSEPFHPTGNSIGYTMQLAHLMGAGRILLHAFTLRNGSRYDFGDLNPITKRPPVYDLRRALDWLTWFESKWTGKAMLVPGWDGPIQDVLQTISLDELLGTKPKAQEWLL